MSILSFLFGRNKKSANLAKQRLLSVLAQERSARAPRRPDYLPALQRELLGVVAKYVKVQSKHVQLNLQYRPDSEVLEVKIQLPHGALVMKRQAAS
jgi:cell division topological specificity factor